MKKPREKPTAEEILKVLDSMWVDLKGLMVVGYKCDTKAREDMRKINGIVKEKYNCTLPKNLVPTEEVIKFYNINISYLQKIANKKCVSPTIEKTDTQIIIYKTIISKIRRKENDKMEQCF